MLGSETGLGAGTDYELFYASRYERRFHERVSTCLIQDSKINIQRS